MAKLKIHAGDWSKGDGSVVSGAFALPKGGFSFMPELVPFTQLAELDEASEDSVTRIGGAVGWGALGAVALGPVGLLAGLLLGGRGKDVTFVARFKDGRKLLATTDSKAFTSMRAALF